MTAPEKRAGRGTWGQRPRDPFLSATGKGEGLLRPGSVMARAASFSPLQRLRGGFKVKRHHFHATGGAERRFPARRYPGRGCVCQELKTSRWELGEGRESVVPCKSSA